MALQSLRDLQTHQGATFSAPDSPDSPTPNPPLIFGPDSLHRVHQPTGCGLLDRSHWRVLDLAGADRLRFLHNQSTNAFQGLQPGQGCETVFVTATARTLDLATAYVLADRVLVLVSPNRGQQLYDWLDRYIFPFDKVQLQLRDFCCFSLVGAASDAVLETLGVGDRPSTPHQHHPITLNGCNLSDDLLLAQGSGLGLPGYTLLMNPADAASVWQALTQDAPQPAFPLGTQDWETLRIQTGRPQPDQELTEDYNPLEAGLWQTVSFDKGCYIGQETIARLNTYKGVKQRLWGLRFAGQPEPGTVLTQGGDRVGKVTSILPTETGAIGLGYIRTKAGGVGLQVQAGAILGEVTEIAYVSHPDTKSVEPETE